MTAPAKTGWAILMFSSPSTISVGDRQIGNYIEVKIPGDMPGLYLNDACPSRRKVEEIFRIYYESCSDILRDGWEPVSVGEHVGGSHGYGRLFSFKKLIKYHPGLYLGEDEIDLSGAPPIG